MATKSRRQNTPLECLLSAPEGFDFFQAIRLLTRHVQGLIKFHLSSENKFPVGLIEKIQQNGNFYQVSVSFGGLTGVTGILPQHYSELLTKTLTEGNTALQDFFNIFNHKIISLLYKAWEKQHLIAIYERVKSNHSYPDDLTKGLYSLSGIGFESLQNQQSIQDDYCAYYVGLFSQQTRTAQALEVILSDYFNLPIKVIQLQGQWLYLNEEDLSSLSSKKSNNSFQLLGKNFVIGQRCWSIQNKFRIYLGPVDYKGLLELLPSHKLLRQIVSMTRFYCGLEFDFDIQIELLADEVPSCSLGKLIPAYLGWNTWLKNKSLKNNVKDVIIHSHVINQFSKLNTMEGNNVTA